MIHAAVFDFDGVVLESAHIKTRAFARLFEAHPDQLEAIVAYHLEHAGVSRYEKFRHIHAEILRIPLDDAAMTALGRRFSSIVLDEIMRCPFVAGARELLERRAGETALFVASGTPEDELRGIVRGRGLEPHFAGVYGSPATKDAILERILREHSLAPEQAMFVGDARTDLEGARAVGVPFVGRVAPGEENPFEGEPIRLVEDLAALDRDWDGLCASPPPVPSPAA